jgi:hypothetical protein
VSRCAVPVGLTAAFLVLLSAVVPTISGTVDIGRATSFHLDTPFDGGLPARKSCSARALGRVS